MYIILSRVRVYYNRRLYNLYKVNVRGVNTSCITILYIILCAYIYLAELIHCRPESTMSLYIVRMQHTRSADIYI